MLVLIDEGFILVFLFIELFDFDVFNGHDFLSLLHLIELFSREFLEIIDVYDFNDQRTIGRRYFVEDY